MSRECAGCGSFRQRVTPVWISCKAKHGGRLCDQIDVSLLRMDRAQSIDEIREIQEAIELAYRPAAKYLFEQAREDDHRIE